MHRHLRKYKAGELILERGSSVEIHPVVGRNLVGEIASPEHYGIIAELPND